MTARASDSQYHKDVSGRIRVLVLRASVLDQLPDARRRQRQFHWLHIEMRQGIGNCVGHDASDRDKAPLAGALGAERIVGTGFQLERYRTNMRKIRSRRQQIVGERSGQQLTVLVIDEMLEKGATKTLDDRTDRLSMQRQRIDDAADVFHRQIV